MRRVACLITGGLGDQILTLPALRYLDATLSKSTVTPFMVGWHKRHTLLENLLGCPLKFAPLEDLAARNSTARDPCPADWILDFSENHLTFQPVKNLNPTRGYYSFPIKRRLPRHHVLSLYDPSLPFEYNSQRWQRCFEMAFRAISRIGGKRFSKKACLLSRGRYRLVPSISPPPGARRRIASLLGPQRRDRIFQLAVTPGGYHPPSKRWPVENFATVIASLLKQKEIRIYLLGADLEFPLAERLLSEVRNRISPPGRLRRVKNLVGRVRLEDLPTLLQGMDLHLTNDNGVAHVGGALNIPQICLYRRRWSTHLTLGFKDTVLFSGHPTETAPIKPEKVLRLIRFVLKHSGFVLSSPQKAQRK